MQEQLRVGGAIALVQARSKSMLSGDPENDWIRGMPDTLAGANGTAVHPLSRTGAPIPA
jgi:hypothetical protein